MEQSAAQFLKLVSEKEIEKAKALSAGIALFNLSNMGTAQKHLVIDVEARMLSSGPSWALVKGKIESINPANETSVHWYEMQLIKQDGWKVYKLKETGPDIKNGRPSPADKERCEEVFRQFSAALLSGRYAEAGKHLIGQAKNAHEISAGWFKDVLVGKAGGIKDITSSVLAGDEENLILKVEYTIDEKRLQTAVSYYRTKGGWKIFDIAQL